MTPPGPGSTPSGRKMPVGSPGAPVPGWAPDLAKAETRINLALLVKL